MDYYLGVDGGGTKTTATVCGGDGSELLTVTGDSVNYRSEGMAAAREHLRAILADIGHRTGVTRFRGAFIGSSALFGRATEEETRAFTGGLVDAETVTMDSDLYIALKACRSDRALAAVCGTGSMAAAFGPDGKVLTRGGFGYLFGDEGSGYAIAREALFHTARAAEGTEPPTALTEALLSHFGVTDVYAFTDLAYDPPLPRKKLASFAPRVTVCAENGDETAKAVLARQAALFADTVRSLARALPQPPEVFLYGGVFAHDSIFTGYFTEEIKDCCASCQPLTTPSAMGAALAAMDCSAPLNAPTTCKKIGSKNIEKGN